MTEVGDRVEPDRETLGFAKLDKFPDGFEREELVITAVDDPEAGAGLTDDNSLRRHPGDGNRRGKQLRVFKHQVPCADGSQAVAGNDEAPGSGSRCLIFLTLFPIPLLVLLAAVSRVHFPDAKPVDSAPGLPAQGVFRRQQ